MPSAQKEKKFRLLQGVLHLSALGVLLATGLSYFSASYFVFDLLCSFRFQYACAGLVLACLFVAQRKLKLVFISLLVFGLNAFETIPFYFSSISPQEIQGPQVKVFFANVEQRNTNYEGVLNAVRLERPDIAIFTEVNDRWSAQLRSIQQEFPYSVVRPRWDKYGMIMLSHFPIRTQEIYETKGLPVSGMTFDVRLDVEGRELRLLASHNLAPLGKKAFDLRNAVLESLSEYVNQSDGATLLVGDLNVTPYSSYFKKLLESAGLFDARNGGGFLPTWPTHTPPLLVPIDHCLHTEHLASLGFRTLPANGSDHSAISCKFRFLGLEQR